MHGATQKQQPQLKEPPERKDAAIPIAWEDRKEAGFTEEELRDLAQLSGEGPSRQTLRKAAEILRERYQARKLQEQETSA